ncbi:DMP19 family protein [Sphingopyxis sp.]|uniref:DMP19 family protein n=1 Tax=Sphingopyxis sp. TaxID=1908224 RepID=UPI002D77A630|nr:hypothetical protein [Sphingopyxis sp.]HET6524669.1 hypothetical protein [Sphingopyxis sp.]
MDTRSALTPEEFEERASYVDSGWWLTGEGLIHTPSVMNVPGWNLYGHPGNEQLTEAQRVLMMWSDMVGQVANGGFEQFISNYEKTLALAYRLIAKLDWPELFERFDPAFREQAGDPANPQSVAAKLWEWDDDDAGANRTHMLDSLARSKTRWRPWARRGERARFDQLSDTILQTLYNMAVSNGEIQPVEKHQVEYEPPPCVAADAFDTWFYLDSTRQESQHYVGSYIRTHRDQLCRIEG